MGDTHSEYVVLPVCVDTVRYMESWVRMFFSGEPEVWYKHPILENNRNSSGKEDGPTCAAEEHPDRGYKSDQMHTHTSKLSCTVVHLRGLR